MRILCAREVQESIADSVHALLKDQVELLGLGHLYEVLKSEIRGRNGTTFVYAGLASHTVESIKSFEGVDIVWVEEGQRVTKRSWDVLQPTIRKPGSEIWISYNPELETDETHQRFTVQPQPDSIVVHMSYLDNPWFPEVLEVERRECEKRDPDGYPNIWLGQCKPAVEGAIYYKQVAGLEAQGRVGHVPYDPLLKVHTIWDLGFNDQMTIICAQRSGSELRVIDYYEESEKTYAEIVADWLEPKRWNWGSDWLPHDGYARSASSTTRDPVTAAVILKKLGRRVRPKGNSIPAVSVEDGIRAAKMIFPRAYFNKATTGRLIECLKRYRRTISRTTDEGALPVHDQYSHGADAWRYLGLVADRLNNDDAAKMPKIAYDDAWIV
jgi:phage terminase large subunit